MNTGTMKKVLHSKNWSVGVVEQHVEIPPIPLIKSKHYYKSDKDFIKLKICRDPTSEKLDLYNFKMALFKKGGPEKFCCSFVTSALISRPREFWSRPQRINAFVRLSV